MVQTVTDVQELVDEVRKCLSMEDELAWGLANVKADTGEALIELEAACNSLGLKRSDMMDMLKEDSVLLQNEILDGESIRNRQRMARLRRNHPDHAHALLMLGISQQKSMVNLTDERIGEFVACGIPLPDDTSVPLAEATKIQVRDAVRAAWRTDPGKPVKIPKPETPKPPPDAAFVNVMSALHALSSLTLEQAEDILLSVMTWLVFDPKATSRTTRRMIEASFDVGYQKEPVPLMEAMQVLQALPQYLANVDVKQATPAYAKGIACNMLTPVIAAIAEWCPPARAEAG